MFSSPVVRSRIATLKPGIPGSYSHHSLAALVDRAGSERERTQGEVTPDFDLLLWAAGWGDANQTHMFWFIQVDDQVLSIGIHRQAVCRANLARSSTLARDRPKGPGGNVIKSSRPEKRPKRTLLFLLSTETAG